MSISDSAEGAKVVIAFLDRKRERGIVYGFRPFHDSFTLYPPGDTTKSNGREVEVKTCKSLYFVRSLEGNRDYKENKLQLPPVYRQGRKIEVSFADGERMVGITEGFNPSRKGFFFYPADPRSNNLEIFVVTQNCEEVRLKEANPDGSDKVFHPGASKGLFLPEKRLDAVQRVLRGESVEKVAKELFIPPATLAEWRALYFSGGAAALGVQPKDG